MAEDAESLKLEMLDEDSLTRQPDEVRQTSFMLTLFFVLCSLFRQMSINDLPVGRSVDETLRLIKVSCDWRMKYFSLIGPD